MRSARCLGLAAALVGCAGVERETRVERGPVLRTFERPVVLEGGLTSRLEARWPTLTVSVLGFDVCRQEKVEELAEEHFTEQTSPTAGPALATGIVNTLAGAGLLLARPLFSGEPRRELIDAGGRYGPSDRQLATGWSYVLLGIGAPALVLGLVQYGQLGEEVELRRVEQVVSATEQACNLRPLDGTLELVGSGLPARKTEAGRVSLSAEELQGRALDSLRLNGRAVELSREESGRLSAFRECLRALAAVERGPESLSGEALAASLLSAQACRGVEGAPAEEWLQRLEAEAQRRQGAAQ